MRWLVVVTVALMFARIEGRAAVLLSDSFNYPDGVLQIVSSNRWIGHAGTTNQVKVEKGTVKLLGSNSQDVNALLDQQPLSAASAPALYAKLKIRFATLPSSNGTYFAHFKDGSSGFRTRIWAQTAGAAQGTFRLGITSTTSSNPTVLQTDLNLDSDYIVVSRLVLSNSVSTLWINPQTENDPGVSTSSGSAFTVAAYALRQATGLGSVSVDDIYVATSFGEVVSGAASSSTNTAQTPQPGATPTPSSEDESKSETPPSSDPPKVIPPDTLPKPPDQNGVPPQGGSRPILPPSPSESSAPRAPAITKSPESIDATAGETVVFIGEATGQAPLKYQWTFNGVDIPGGTSPAIQFASVTGQHAGEYRLFVSNLYGTATSAAAILKVADARPLNHPVQITIMPLPGTGLALVWVAQPMIPYSVYTTDNVSAPFQALTTGLTFPNGNGTYVVTDLATAPIRFFLISWP